VPHPKDCSHLLQRFERALSLLFLSLLSFAMMMMMMMMMMTTIGVVARNLETPRRRRTKTEKS
jgi:hypothetical protein